MEAAPPQPYSGQYLFVGNIVVAPEIEVEEGNLVGEPPVEDETLGMDQ